MRLRPLFLTLAILAPVAAGVWWLQRPQAQPATLDPRVGRRVADPATLASAARIELKADNRTLGFTRSTEGRWTLEGTPALPADLSRLGRLSSDLLTPKIERFVTANPSRLASLELDQTRISYFDAGGKPLLALDLGKNADGGGRFLRFDAEPKAYLGRLNLNLDASPESWRDTALVAGLKSADIASLTLQFPDTPDRLTFSRPAADKPWTSPATPAGRQVKASLLDTQAGNLATLRYTNLAPNLDPGVIAARILPREASFTTFSGRIVKITLARAAELPRPPPRPRKAKPPRRPRRPPRLVPFMSSSPTRNPTPSWSPPPAPTPSRSPNGFSTVCPVNRPTPSSPSPPLRRRPPPPSR